MPAGHEKKSSFFQRIVLLKNEAPEIDQTFEHTILPKSYIFSFFASSSIFSTSSILASGFWLMVWRMSSILTWV